MAGAALFSPCGRYRWWLLRRWRPDRAPVVFVGLNPSTADGAREDATLRRLRGLAWLSTEPSPRGGPPPRVWLGWGQRGGRHGRDRRLLELLRCWAGIVVCAGTTRDGHPRHPLYTRADQAPLPFTECPSP